MNIMELNYNVQGEERRKLVDTVNSFSQNCIGNNRSQAQKNSGYHYLHACRPIFPY